MNRSIELHHQKTVEGKIFTSKEIYVRLIEGQLCETICKSIDFQTSWSVHNFSDIAILYLINVCSCYTWLGAYRTIILYLLYTP